MVEGTKMAPPTSPTGLNPASAVTPVAVAPNKIAQMTTPPQVPPQVNTSKSR